MPRRQTLTAPRAVTLAACSLLLIIAVALLPPPASAAQADCPWGRVCIFDDANYGGAIRSWEPGPWSVGTCTQRVDIGTSSWVNNSAYPATAKYFHLITRASWDFRFLFSMPAFSASHWVGSSANDRLAIICF